MMSHLVAVALGAHRPGDVADVMAGFAGQYGIKVFMTDKGATI